MNQEHNVSVTYNPYRTFKKEHINRDQFLPANSEDEYNEIGKNDVSILLKKLKKYMNKKPYSILEFGCGDARVARWMAKECRKMTLVDVSPFVLEAAQEKMVEYGNVDNVEYVLADDFLQENKFDFIYCLQVIQHNPYSEQIEIVQKIQKALKPNGIACIHLPKIENKPDYKNIDTCMCFTKDQAIELGSYFSECIIEDDTSIVCNDYYLWCKK